MCTNESTKNFIQEFIEEDLKNGKYKKIHTRFPPEPNGYLHIGHAKAICIDFGMALNYNGLCNLRFDDTNPSKEDTEFVESIKEDIKWLGFDWEDRLYYASSYFDKLFEFAVELIKKEKAYVCDLTADEIREYRGTLTVPGKESPYRKRSIEENLDLFYKMKDGKFDNGKRVLRAKIDMSSPNLNMRDPVIYRILKESHHKTKDKWCIYPMYDYAHPLSDWLEGITHSLCSIEFEDHRPLYNWFLEELELPCLPRQIEFARLNITHTMLSKRKLTALVEENIVEGWNDPRMPTLSGLRRKGYTPSSIKNFINTIGVSKSNSTVDLALLEHCIRTELNKTADRVMVVLNPVKVIIDNYPDEKDEIFDIENNPENPAAGTRKVPFSKIIYIERDDFMEEPFKKFFRLGPGREVRLKNAYFIKCVGFNKDPKTGEISEIHCTYDPTSRGGNSPDGRKVKGTIHWVSEKHAANTEIRLYNTLFSAENPAEETDADNLKSLVNQDSIVVLKNSKAEPSLLNCSPSDTFQFMRKGYFCCDIKDSSPGHLVFNRTVPLKDTWAKIKKNM